jgi:DinB superfamily
MKSILISALLCMASTLLLAQAHESKSSSSPVADATRTWLEHEASYLTASAEEMPADKYDFHPTPQQMTFAQLMEHIAGSNRFMCSSIAGEAAPKGNGTTEKDGKDTLVADVKASFDYCNGALAKADDSKLGEEVPWFGKSQKTRAFVMVALAADLADHYSMAANYLRLNGMLPPTAKPKK